MKNKQQESVKREGDKEEIVRKKEKRAVSSATSVFLTLKMKTKKNVLGKMRKLMAMQRTMLQIPRRVKPGKMMEDGGQLLINSEAS